MVTLHTRESQNPECRRGSEIEREHGCVRHLELGMRRGAWGASKDHCKIIIRPDTLVNKVCFDYGWVAQLTRASS